jgi:hypothetical protein
MNYKKHYEKLIEKARSRCLDEYSEKHHIVPKCMGGSDDNSNLVSLTAREHFIAHLLLVKIYPSNLPLVRAVAVMCIGQDERKLTNRWYGKVREAFSVAMSAAQTGELNSQYGTIWICNGVEAKKIKSSQSIPDGWVRGRSIKSISKKVSKKEINKKMFVDMYTKYYEIYSNVGFEEFVKQTGYDKSLPNLVQMFNRHVDAFVPQNGKKRK